MLKGEKLKAFPLRLLTGLRCALSPILHNIVLEVLARGIQWDEKSTYEPEWKR